MSSRMKDGVVKRGKTWSYVIRVGGKPKWVGGYRTQTAAKAARDEARSSVRQNAYVAPSKETFGDYLAGWLTTQKSQVKASTWENYERRIRRRITPALGTVLLGDLSADTLDQFYQSMLDQGLSLAFVRLNHAVINKALRSAVKKRKLARNPATEATLPKVAATDDDVEDMPYHVWTAPQFHRFVKAVDDERDRALWALLGTTGLRRGEALALRWDDLDLDANKLRVRRQIDHRKKVTRPKSDASSREFTLDSSTVDVLRRHRRAQRAERLQLGLGRPDGTTYVFTTVKGHPMAPSAMSARFQRLITHQRANAVFNAGVDPLQVAAMAVEAGSPQTIVALRAELRRRGGHAVTLRKLTALQSRARAQGADHAAVRRLDMMIVNAGGVPVIRLHDLRHTAATMMLNAGIDVRAVARRLGHSNASITLRVYAKWLPSEDQAAADAFGRYLDRAAGQ